MVPSQSLKLARLLPFSFIVFFFIFFSSNPAHALNIGVQATVPPFLRYGKYCGLLYSGCPGEIPCDGLDACCMKHDACVQSKNNDYLSQECSQNFINCMENFRNSKGRTFKGNKCEVDEVIGVINVVMEAALLAGRVLHKP
ncbi:hypothetical protein FNV43_RR03950 [Rhamnella rubrinervis]|uniref:phospholipase A2 n=1 Tax=Rhamnella rubrinervis TaxID=2594499 RepID=A0A8K0HKT0_9ROSA|nr:hypothetical protein FNV43_RR03950 [Rhamnella rubrinervis]